MFRKFLHRSPLRSSGGAGVYEHVSRSLRVRVTAFVLCLSLIFGAFFYTEREARSWAFLLLPGVEMVLSTGGVVGLALNAAAFGAAVYFLHFKKPDNSTGLTVKLNPLAEEEVPPGWTAASDPTQDPVPPDSAGSPTTDYQASLTFCGSPATLVSGSSVAAYGAAYAGYVNSCSTRFTTTYCGASGSTALFTVVDDLGFQSCLTCGSCGSSTPQQVEVCPVGYTLQAGDCVLTQPYEVKFPVDNKCVAKLSAGAIGFNSRDPDCEGGLPAGVELGTAGKSLIVVKDGEKTVITSKSDNTISLEKWVGNGDGTSNYTGITLSSPDFASATGGTAITGQAGGLVVGEGTLAAEGVEGDNLNKKSCGAPGQPPCRIDESGMPSGPGGVADSGKSSLNAKTPADFGVTPWTGSGVGTFSGLPSISGSDACVNPINWVWMGHMLNPDMCAIWGPLKGGLAWFLYAMTALYIWRRVTTAL